MNDQPIPQHLAGIMPNLTHDPWQNPNLWPNPMNVPSDKLILPSVNRPLTGSPPPLPVSQNHLLNESSIERAKIDSWHNANLRVGPSISSPHPVNEKMGQGSTTVEFPTPTITPPANQINSSPWSPP
jgi:hypothetical protein